MLCSKDGGGVDDRVATEESGIGAVGIARDASKNDGQLSLNAVTEQHAAAGGARGKEDEGIGSAGGDDGKLVKKGKGKGGGGGKKEMVMVCPLKPVSGDEQESEAARKKRADKAQKKLMNLVGKVCFNINNNK